MIFEKSTALVTRYIKNIPRNILKKTMRTLFGRPENYLRHQYERFFVENRMVITIGPKTVNLPQKSAQIPQVRRGPVPPSV